MTASPETPLLLAPHCDAALLRAHFTAAGWREAPHLPPPEQQPDDDRLLGLWLSPDGASAEWVSDGFVHRLAFRDATPADVDAAAAALPLPTRDDLAPLLDADDPLRCIAGARAAALRPDPMLAPRLALLAATHAHAGVRAEAQRALTLSVPALAAHGSALLQAGPVHGPGPGAVEQRHLRPHLWPLLGPAWFRRQALRWLLQDEQISAAALTILLGAALADPDWEVRAGAMIGAARRRLAALGGAIEQCPWPGVSRDGPDAAHRSLLRAMQQVACALLAGRAPPAGESPKRKLLARIAALLTAPEPAPADAAGLFCRALTEPVHSPEPDGTCGSAGALAGLDLVAVPATGSWLGDGIDAPPEPIRTDGFRIARLPVGMTNAGGPVALDGAAAEDWCRAHSAPGLRLRLPTVREWVCMARGNDGRQFPWGNGFAADSIDQPGPWGTCGHGAQPEWALDDNRRPVRCGSACVARHAAAGPALLRPLLAAGPD